MSNGSQCDGVPLETGSSEAFSISENNFCHSWHQFALHPQLLTLPWEKLCQKTLPLLAGLRPGLIINIQ